MTDVTHKGKVIGYVYLDEEYDDWCYKHSPSGNSVGGYDTKVEAIKDMREDHLYYLKELEDRWKATKKEMNEWKDHLK